MNAIDEQRRGRLFGIGVGPGDPELMTLKALRLLQAAPVVADFAARGRPGNAFAVVSGFLDEAQIRLTLRYPVTVEKLPPPFSYETVLRDFYNESAASVAAHLDIGRDVAVICEGDPFFYGSFMYLHDRLAQRYETEVVPGVCSVMAAAAAAGQPLIYRNQALTVLSGVMTEAELTCRLAGCEAAAIMKLGGNFAKVRGVLRALGREAQAVYVERATMAGQRIAPLAVVDPASVPYFAMILVPGERWCASVATAGEKELAE
jgi:precorrin-2/cobalt-factor-2 C20-methyltransferase